MISDGIGVKVADLYINWAYYHEINGDFAETERMFKRGIEASAEPSDLLTSAHEEFGFWMSHQLFYGQSNKYHENLKKRLEKISSLSLFETKVIASKSSELHRFSVSALMKVCIPNYAETSPDDHNTSIVRNIVDSLKKLRCKRNVQTLTSACCLDFPNDALHPSTIAVNYTTGNIQLNHKFKPKSLPRSPSKAYIDPTNNVSEKYQLKLPGYDKIMLIPADNLAFSADELKAYKWFKQRNIENEFTKEMDKVWGVGYDVPIRWPNVFPRTNLTQSDWFVPRIMPDELNETEPHKFMCNMTELYPKNTIEEFSREEIMWKRKSSAVNGGNMTRVNVFNDQLKIQPNTGAIPKKKTTNKSFVRNKPVPNRPKGLGTKIFEQQMEIARALNRTKNIKPKALFFSEDEKENVLIPENLQHLYAPGSQRNTEFKFKQSARAIFSVKNTVEATSGTDSSLKLTTSIEEEIFALNDMIKSVLNAADNYGNGPSTDLNAVNAANQPIDCSTPIKRPAHNYSFSYELFETTAEFERLEALCAISPVKSPLTQAL